MRKKHCHVIVPLLQFKCVHQRQLQWLIWYITVTRLWCWVQRHLRSFDAFCKFMSCQNTRFWLQVTVLCMNHQDKIGTKLYSHSKVTGWAGEFVWEKSCRVQQEEMQSSTFRQELRRAPACAGNWLVGTPLQRRIWESWQTTSWTWDSKISQQRWPIDSRTTLWQALSSCGGGDLSKHNSCEATPGVLGLILGSPYKKGMDLIQQRAATVMRVLEHLSHEDSGESRDCSVLGKECSEWP